MVGLRLVSGLPLVLFALIGGVISVFVCDDSPAEPSRLNDVRARSFKVDFDVKRESPSNIQARA